VLGAASRALLFLNRRGYAPLTLCVPAGIVSVPNCTLARRAPFPRA